ncbi:MAG: response regulator, partial [Thermodesulfobacteriota bacterium]|nr:response regulator [Thermodesulfobacteriota bacterium]
GEVEIDRRILEEMKDPLIHLLRNAIDHGLEDPEKRAEMQKPCSGIINLTVSQSEGNKVEINLSDDGGGIDLVKVKEKAIRKGFLSQGGADALKDEEIMLFIFRSEISTSPIITEISGRGIGLAIVQERVEQLGGVLSVETKLGVGTSFTMQLPVTQATFRGVLVRIGESLFILPASHVERVMRIEQEHIKTVENKATMPLDGWVLPFCDLGDVLKISRQKTPQKGNQSDSTALVTVMILGTGEKRVAFCIDEVIGEQEVLVKNLGKQLSRVPNIAGATILGTGKIVPALNVNDLLKSSHYTTHIPTDTKMNWREEEVGEKSVLVVEDSITSRVLLKNILEADGYLVHTAFDGRDAYTILKTERFDVVVSDVEMPRMNGFELTAKIRSDPRLAEVPVVLVTSLDSREDRERGIDVGADAYIVKSSFDQTNLLEVIRRLV